MPQFYIKPENISAGKFYLDKSESHHLASVLRKSEGEEIRLFDGKGNTYTGRIESAHCKNVSGIIISSKKHEPRYDVTIFPALIKEANFEWLVEKAVEIGVTRIQPVVSCRTEVKSGKKSRWEKIILSAAKQSDYVFLPEINEPKNFQEALKDDSSGRHNIFFWENESSGNIGICVGDAVRIGLWTGPTGGFTEEEYESAREMGFSVRSLGRNVLRAETACLAGLVLVKYELEKRVNENLL